MKTNTTQSQKKRDDMQIPTELRSQERWSRLNKAQKLLFLNMLQLANINTTQEKVGQSILTVHEGEFLTTLRKLTSLSDKLPISALQRALKKLETHHFIKLTPIKRLATKIQIRNWQTYRPQLTKTPSLEVPVGPSSSATSQYDDHYQYHDHYPIPHRDCPNPLQSDYHPIRLRKRNKRAKKNLSSLATRIITLIIDKGNTFPLKPLLQKILSRWLQKGGR